MGTMLEKIVFVLFIVVCVSVVLFSLYDGVKYRNKNESTCYPTKLITSFEDRDHRYVVCAGYNDGYNIREVK